MADPITLTRDHHSISRSDIDPGVVNILYTLLKNKYRACLVGGCVRDLLLGHKPKDFDVATDATPEQVRRLFGRCFIIGRRFRLAHVYTSKKDYVEVATFRGAGTDDANGATRPDGSPDKFAANNVFGSIEEDSVRRDFTINALYYDLDGFKVLDYNQGLADIESRTIRMIGDPKERLLEDPVRIIRVAKFAGRLDCNIDPALETQCKDLASSIEDAHPSRRIEEVFKILQSGSSAKIFKKLVEFEASHYLVPSLLHEESDTERLYSRLEVIDKVVGEGHNFSRGVLIAALFYDFIMDGLQTQREAAGHYVDPYRYFKDHFKPLAIDMRLTKAEREIVRRTIAMQDRFANPKKRRFSKRKFMGNAFFADAFELFEINSLAHNQHEEEVAYWKKLATDLMEQGEIPSSGDANQERSQKRRRRRRRPRKRTE